MNGSLWSWDVTAIRKTVNDARGAQVEIRTIDVLPNGDVTVFTNEGNDIGNIYRLGKVDGEWSVKSKAWWTRRPAVRPTGIPQSHTSRIESVELLTV